MKDYKVVPIDANVTEVTPPKVARLVLSIKLGLNGMYLNKIRPYMLNKEKDTKEAIRQLKTDSKDSETERFGLAHIMVSAKIDRLEKQAKFYDHGFRKLMTSPDNLKKMISYKVSQLSLLAQQSLNLKRVIAVREDGSVSPTVTARYKNTLKEIKEAEDPKQIVKLAGTDISDNYDEEMELEEDARDRLTTLAIKMEKIIQEISEYKKVLDEVKNILGEENKKKGK